MCTHSVFPAGILAHADGPRIERKTTLFASAESQQAAQTHDNVHTGRPARPNRDDPPIRSFISLIYNKHTYTHDPCRLDDCIG